MRGRDVLAAATVAGALSGAPSTLHALATGRDPLEATYAAGSVLMNRKSSRRHLFVAGAVAHALISMGWTAVLLPVLQRRPHPVPAGAALGLVIAVVDLSIARRRFPRIAALPTAPQVADHAAFGALVGLVAQEQRAS